LYECYKTYEYFRNKIEYIKSIKINDLAKRYLIYIAHNPASYAYDIVPPNREISYNSDTDIKKTNQSNYRKANIILNRLCKSKLIKLDIDSKEKDPHGKKRYSLTEDGLFFLVGSPIFLNINFQNIIKSCPNSKLFDILLSSFIKLDTLCSLNNESIMWVNLSFYIQKHYLKIENFIARTGSRSYENEFRYKWNRQKLEEYLKREYKCEWIDDAEIEENYEGTNLKFINISMPSSTIEIKLENNTGYIVIKEKKRKENNKKIKNLQNFYNILSVSREEKIGRIFSNLIEISASEFIFSIMSPFRIFDLAKSNILNQDNLFTKSLERTRKTFDKAYNSVMNPKLYSFETLFIKGIFDIANDRELNI